MRVDVIAEVGVNHNGNWLKALDLIDAAKTAGADVVKFQLFSADKLKRPELRPLELSQIHMRALKAHCEEVGIEFLCTPFDLDSLQFLVDLGVKRLKISSGCITNKSLLTAAKNSGLPIIISTGMSTPDQAWDAYRLLGHCTTLHCTSAYPCPVEDVNLRVLDRLPPPFGYSDHTDGIIVALAAVARGATVIEKHLTLDRDQNGPDHKASVEPDEFKDMVDGIRYLEKALGDGIKRPMPSEKPAMKIWRTDVHPG
jgi:N,N'-diacetyllegionaminate synthase